MNLNFSLCCLHCSRGTLCCHKVSAIPPPSRGTGCDLVWVGKVWSGKLSSFYCSTGRPFRGGWAWQCSSFPWQYNSSVDGYGDMTKARTTLYVDYYILLSIVSLSSCISKTSNFSVTYNSTKNFTTICQAEPVNHGVWHAYGENAIVATSQIIVDQCKNRIVANISSQSSILRICWYCKVTRIKYIHFL